MLLNPISQPFILCTNYVDAYYIIQYYWITFHQIYFGIEPVCQLFGTHMNIPIMLIVDNWYSKIICNLQDKDISIGWRYYICNRCFTQYILVNYKIHFYHLPTLRWPGYWTSSSWKTRTCKNDVTPVVHLATLASAAVVTEITFKNIPGFFSVSCSE